MSLTKWRNVQKKKEDIKTTKFYIHIGILRWTRGHWLPSTSENAWVVAGNQMLNILSQSYEKTSITLGHKKRKYRPEEQPPFPSVFLRLTWSIVVALRQEDSAEAYWFKPWENRNLENIFYEERQKVPQGSLKKHKSRHN